MSASNQFSELQGKLLAQAGSLQGIVADVTAYQALFQERHEQLTHRYEAVERKVDDITNLDAAHNQKLLAKYDRLMEIHAQSEEELDSWENEVLEPLREVQEVMLRLLA